ncbi:MAG: S26 family signal peptidase [Dissulfuribacterales bacterium]
MQKQKRKQWRVWTAKTILVYSILTVISCCGLNYFSNRYMIGVQMLKAKCLPWVLYVIKKEPPAIIERGQLVVLPLPQQAIDLHPKVRRLRNRGFLLKIAMGLPGDHIMVKNDRLYINGHVWGRLWLLHNLQKPKGFFDRDLTIKEGEVFVLGTLGDSYDSRYWGPIKQTMLKGTARVLF